MDSSQQAYRKQTHSLHASLPGFDARPAVPPSAAHFAAGRGRKQEVGSQGYLKYISVTMMGAEGAALTVKANI